MSGSAKCKKTVFFTMVLHPSLGWIRVGNAYGSRAIARGWLGFVRDRWRLPAKVSACTITFNDGALDERSVRVLDTKFNLDPPSAEVGS